MCNFPPNPMHGDVENMRVAVAILLLIQCVSKFMTFSLDIIFRGSTNGL